MVATKTKNASGANGEIEIHEKDVEFVRTGTKIIIPENMSLDELGEWVERKKEEEDSFNAFNFEVECFPLDGAVNFHRALRDLFGWTSMQPSFGWWGPSPPTMIEVPTSNNETIKVAWGRVAIPGLEGELSTGMTVTGGIPKFTISGEVRLKHMPKIEAIISKTREFVRDHSIYKGKAIRLDLEWVRAGHQFNPVAHSPKFMDLAEYTEQDLILPQDVEKALKLGLYIPIERADILRRQGVQGKRGVLLIGRYGTGKTLAANVTALKAERSGWTFVYLKSVLDFSKGLDFARQYGRTILFAEDLDRITSGNRTAELDALMNNLDGIDSKKDEIIAVMTTNNQEAVHPAMKRPGRFDLLVEFREPDADAAERLVRHYGRGLISPQANLRRVGELLKGRIPSMIKEVTQRSQLAALDRIAENGATDLDLTGQVQEEDLVDAAMATEAHSKLLSPRDEEAKHPLQLFGEAIGVQIGDAITGREQIIEQLKKIEAATAPKTEQPV